VPEPRYPRGGVIGAQPILRFAPRRCVSPWFPRPAPTGARTSSPGGWNVVNPVTVTQRSGPAPARPARASMFSASVRARHHRFTHAPAAPA
jgi:hypothetical protein